MVTPRERILTAMSLKRPDRIPVMCQMSIGHMLQQLPVSPAEFWFDRHTFARGLIKLRELYNFDGILVSLHGHSPDWRDRVVNIETRDRGEILRFGDRTMIFGRDDLPVVKFDSEPLLPSIDELDPASVPDSIHYIPVSQGLHYSIDRAHPFDIFDDLSAQVGTEYSIHGEVTSPFDYFLDLLGHENALMAMIEDPDKTHAILQRFTTGIAALTGAMCEKPIDAIKISSPFAGMGFISPAFYGEFVMPYEKQIVDVAKAKGKFIYIHTCGAINDRLELMRDSGASGLECLDPPPLGNVDLTEAVKRIGGDMFIKGNIDSVNTLLYGDEAELDDEIKGIILSGMRSRGFLLSTACAIAPHVERTRVQRLVKLAEQHGRYD